MTSLMMAGAGREGSCDQVSNVGEMSSHSVNSAWSSGSDDGMSASGPDVECLETLVELEELIGNDEEFKEFVAAMDHELAVSEDSHGGNSSSFSCDRGPVDNDNSDPKQKSYAVITDLNSNVLPPPKNYVFHENTGLSSDSLGGSDGADEISEEEEDSLRQSLLASISGLHNKQLWYPPLPAQPPVPPPPPPIGTPPPSPATPITPQDKEKPSEFQALNSFRNASSPVCEIHVPPLEVLEEGVEKETALQVSSEPPPALHPIRPESLDKSDSCDVQQCEDGALLSVKSSPVTCDPLDVNFIKKRVLDLISTERQEYNLQEAETHGTTVVPETVAAVRSPSLTSEAPEVKFSIEVVPSEVKPATCTQRPTSPTTEESPAKSLTEPEVRVSTHVVRSVIVPSANTQTTSPLTAELSATSSVEPEVKFLMQAVSGADAGNTTFPSYAESRATLPEEPEVIFLANVVRSVIVPPADTRTATSPSTAKLPATSSVEPEKTTTFPSTARVPISDRIDVSGDKATLSKRRSSEPWVSTDAAENADNSEWELLQRLNTDEERYKVLRARWRNLTIPEPKKDLTVSNFRKQRLRSMRKRDGENSYNTFVESMEQRSRKRTRSYDDSYTLQQPPSKRQRVQSCRSVFDSRVADLKHQMNVLRDDLRSKYRNDLHRLSIEQQRQQNALINARGNPAVIRLEISRLYHRQVQEVDILANKYDARIRNTEAEKQRQINLLQDASDEFYTFHKFYHQLYNSESTENQMLVTEDEVEEFCEADNMYEYYDQFYRG